MKFGWNTQHRLDEAKVTLDRLREELRVLNQEVRNQEDPSAPEPQFGVVKKRSFTEYNRDQKQAEVASHLLVFQKARTDLETEKLEFR